MIKNTIINRKATQKVAKALGELNKDVVFVGGAIVSFYIDDTAAEDVRPTKDIDISLKIASLTELEEIRIKLNNKGFHQSAEDDVICRFRYEDVKVDIMSTKAIGWAPGNRWFELGFPKANIIEIENTSIQILPFPYFLASKFDAFNSRGGNDPRTSHDFEDIVYLLNYTSYLRDSILDSPNEVKMYLMEQFKEILNDDLKQEAILAHLYYENQMERYNYVIKLLSSI